MREDVGWEDVREDVRCDGMVEGRVCGEDMRGGCEGEGCEGKV